MALQSEVSPTIVGDPNKDTQIDGDTKSDENHSSQSTDEDADLEDGEILESEAEEEKDFSNVSLKEALDKSCLQSIELLVNKAKEPKHIASPDHTKMLSPRKMKRMADNYLDHDRNEHSSDHEKGWVPSSPKSKSKFGDKPLDYRMELAAYRGTPPSSPERSRRDDKSKKRKSSRKPKKSKKTIRRKDAKGQRVAGYKRDAARGKICKFYKEGKCAKGSSCYFSHSAPSFKKRELCKFYLNGHCNKGKDCVYMHGEFPCKFYHTGSECYAKDDCRFSHAPLTEEMKKLLADYLRSCHGDDIRHNRSDDRERDHNDRDWVRDDREHHEHERGEHDSRDREHNRDRKRHASPDLQPPPAKRTCLLGSPPRHIREAEDTKRWREEMKMLQEQSHPSFQICLSPGGENAIPMELSFNKPNFYQDTLLNTPSPKRRPPNMEPPNSFLHNNTDNYGESSPSKVYIYDEDDFVEIDMSVAKQEKPPDEYHWENDHDMHSHEMHSREMHGREMHGHEMHSREMHGHEMHSHEEEDIKPFIETSHQEPDFTSDIKFDETTQFSEMESSTDCAHAQSPDSANQATSDDASNHEDKQQQQPDDSAPPIVVPTHLPRIQQELFMRVQKHQRLNAANVGGSPTGNDGEDAPVKKEVESDAEEKSATEAKDGEWYTSEEEEDEDDPPLTDVLKKIQQDPVPKPQPPEVKPKVDLLAIFNTIQQKTKEKNKGLTEVQQKHSSFWQNILGGVSASKAAAATTTVPVSNPVTIEQPKRRTLLPDPIIKAELPSSPAEPPAIKDPRLKNRDPRKLAREAKPVVDVPKPACIDSSPSIQEVSSLSVKPTASEQEKESIPYRLRGIVAKPPNYTPYLHASQSNPSLLKDPRLRKHLKSSDSVNGIEKGHETVKLPAPPKDAPPIPELLLKYEKPVAAINIFESSSSNKPDAKPSIPVTIPVSYDPVDSKNRAPVPVAYDPPDLKIQVPAPYDPIDSKITIPAPISYDPIDSMSRAPVPVSYDPEDSKRSVLASVSYDPVDSKRNAPFPVSYCPVDSKSILPTPVSYDLVDSKSSIPVSGTYNTEDSKSRTNIQVTCDSANSKSSTSLSVTALKSHVPIPVAITRGPVSLKRHAPITASRKDPRTKRRDSIASNSGSDTPPHLTIVDNVPSPNPQDSKSAPVLMNELMETDEKNQPSPVIEKKAPSSPDKNVRTDIKKEVESAKNSKKNLVDIKKNVESVTSSKKNLTDSKKVESVTSSRKNSTDSKKEVESASSSKKNLTNIKKDVQSTTSSKKNLANIKKAVESTTSSKKNVVDTKKDAESVACSKKNLVDIKKDVESVSSSKKKLSETKKDVETVASSKKNLADSKKDVESVEGSKKNLADTKKEVESLTSNKKNLLDTKKEGESSTSSKKNLVDITKDDEDSDSDSNMDVPLILLSGKSSYKKSPSPPIVEEFMTVIKKEVPQDVTGDSKPVVPPLIIKKVKPSPTPASHLPRAIADPRMAKLHNPRRPRAATSASSPSKRVSERRKQPAAETVKATAEDLEEENSSSANSEGTKPAKASKDAKAEEKPKAVKCIPKKRRLSDKSEEKKKTVHRNRKSSMDYASPLNSCDATDNSKGSSYNRYNQRPKRGVNVPQISQVEVPSQSDSNSIPEFALSDSSNLECDNSSDVNLKDRFKTIDPTASPFC